MSDTYFTHRRRTYSEHHWITRYTAIANWYIRFWVDYPCRLIIARHAIRGDINTLGLYTGELFDDGSRSAIITLSKWYLVSCPEAKIIDTILHEIAHAISPFNENHGDEWTANCVRVGAEPTATKSGM